MPTKGPKLKSLYANGWSEAKKRLLEATELPEKTRCFECGKLQKTAMAFSEKQQTDLRHAIANGQIRPEIAMGKWIRCRTCTGVQKAEMTCIMCDEVKGLDGFAKAQRRTPDAARCMSCVAEVSNSVPYDKPAAEVEAALSDEEHDLDSDTETNPYGSTTDDLDSESGVAVPHDDLNDINLQTLNISTRGTSAQPSRPTQSASVSVSHSKASASGVARWQALSRGQYVGYDSHGNAHKKALSTTSSAGSESNTTATNVVGTGAVKPEPRFAKVQSGHRKVPVPEYKGGRTVARYDSEDEDDDEDDDFFTI